MQVGYILDSIEAGGAIHRFGEMRALALHAEQAGFDSIWMADHLLWRVPGEEDRGLWEAFTFLSALAAVTSRIRVGPLVACTAFRQPGLLAKMADSIDEISNGRFILGLGAGFHEPEYDAFGYPFDHRFRRFEEALQIILPLLRTGHIDFHGRYYHAHEAVLRPRGPSTTGPPIWVAASGPRMMQLTARHADGWNCTDDELGAERLAGKVTSMLAVCERVGRDPATLTLTAKVDTRLLAPGERRTEGDPVITGGPEEVAAMLRACAETGLDHAMIIDPVQTPDRIERYARVLELLREQEAAGSPHSG